MRPSATNRILTWTFYIKVIATFAVGCGCYHSNQRCTNINRMLLFKIKLIWCAYSRQCQCMPSTHALEHGLPGNKSIGFVKMPIVRQQWKKLAAAWHIRNFVSANYARHTNRSTTLKSSCNASTTHRMSAFCRISKATAHIDISKTIRKDIFARLDVCWFQCFVHVIW